jgi:hypothetical protein
MDELSSESPEFSADTAPRHRRPRNKVVWAAGLAVLLVLALGAVFAVLHNGKKAAQAADRVPVAATTDGTSSTPAASASVAGSPSAGTGATTGTPAAGGTTKAPAAKTVSSGKKGVSVWSFDGVTPALAQSTASWYYTWSTSHNGITTPTGVGFVPMIWGAKSVTSGELSAAKAAGPYLLGFNEPDFASQSNMSPEQALGFWPQLMNAGRILGSPAVAVGGDKAGGWLDRFMSGAADKGYRVDFIALHWYGGDFNTGNAVGQLKAYLTAVYNRFHKPIWLTEYSLINFSGNGPKFPTPQAQSAFVTASASMLSGLPWLQRYAWFALPADEGSSGTGLFTAGPQITPVGKAFQAAG